MPIGYTHVKNLDLTVVVWDGVVQADEWKRHVVRMTSDRRFPTSRVLTDGSSANTEDLVVDDATSMAELFALGLEGDVLPEKAAIVLTPNSFELGEAYQDRFHAAVGFAMFPNLADACRWLGVPWGNVNEAVEKVRDRLRQPA